MAALRAPDDAKFGYDPGPAVRFRADTRRRHRGRFTTGTARR
jgi:hypothetical protein